MASLVFDGATHRITLLNGENQIVGAWDANNVVDHSATMRFVPNSVFPMVDRTTPHRHGGVNDTLDGSYGRFGILRIAPFAADGVMHVGVGVHAGRRSRGAQNHPTFGCIRTTDEAMEAITRHTQADPLTTITVLNNHRQENVTAHHAGDHHHTPVAPLHDVHHHREESHAISPAQQIFHIHSNPSGGGVRG